MCCTPIFQHVPMSLINEQQHGHMQQLQDSSPVHLDLKNEIWVQPNISLYHVVPPKLPKRIHWWIINSYQFPMTLPIPLAKKNIHFVGESLHFSLRKFLGSDPKRPGAKIWTAPSVAVRPRGSVKTSRAAPCVRFEPRRICQKSQLSRYVFHICCSIYTDD